MVGVKELIDRDPAKILPALMVKVNAVIADVDGHLPDGYRLALFEGVRSKARQLYLFEAGRSMTTHSKHFPQRDGLARAADLMFQKRNAAGEWKWLSWEHVPAEWLRWLMSSKTAHNVRAPKLDWDKPHCQWLGK